MSTTETDVPHHYDDPPTHQRRRLTLDSEVLGFRTIAFLPAIIFVPTISSEVALPGTSIGPIFGVFFHLAALFFVSRVPAPQWAKAAGFGWLALDVAVAVGIMDVNGVPENIFMPMRLGGHVLAATWIIAVSLLSRPIAFRVVGLVTAALLALYSFLGTVLPVNFLIVPSVGTVVWFVIAALRHEPDPLGGVRRRSPSLAQEGQPASRTQR